MTARRLWALSFGVFVLLGVGWMFASPMTAVPDEPAQIVRGVSLWRGELLGDETVVSQHDPNVLNITDAKVTVPEAYAHLEEIPTCFAFDPSATADCAPAVRDGTVPVTGHNYLSRYPPTYHLAVTWPSLVLAPGAALWTMRGASMVLAAALLACAVSLLPAIRGARLLVAGLALAITPQTLFLAAAVNPSGFEIAAAVLAWVGLLAVIGGDGEPSPSVLVRAAVGLGAFTLARPISPALAVVAVALVWMQVGSRARWRVLWSSPRVRRTLLVVGGLLLLSVVWVVSLHTYTTQAGYPAADMSTGDIVWRSLGDTQSRGRQMIGQFGWIDVELPTWVVDGWYAAVAMLVAVALVVGRGRDRIVVVAAIAAVEVLPTVGDVIGASKVGIGWQGRYMLPVAVGVPLLAAFAADRGGRVPSRWARWIGVAVAAFVGVAALVALASTVRRYATGADFALFDYLTWSRWSPRIGQWPLFVVSVVGSTLLAAGTAALAVRTTGATDGVGSGAGPASGRRGDGTRGPSGPGGGRAPAALPPT